MITLPEQHAAERHVGDRLLIIELDRLPRVLLGLSQGLRRIGHP